MTTQTTDVRVPPRPVIRTFWMLHRAAYRLTGGRFGLKAPTKGAGFGFLRLTTVGNRTGKARVAILGYFEDGENLVTLAMNGWADAEPAWWRNLQARPEATVELAGEQRTVVARAAPGAEHDRLWARFDDFPGWGDDLDGLAARRSRPTTVVVFEPRSGAKAGVR